MSSANRIVKNTGFLYGKMAITVFISLYTTRLILASLGASDYGIFNVIGGAISMLAFLNSTMASATQRFMNYSEGEGNKEKQKTIFNVSIVMHFTVAILFCFIMAIAYFFLFNGVLNIPEDRMLAAKWVYLGMVLSTTFTVMSVPYDAAINAHENMLYYAIIGIFESLLKLAIAFYVSYTMMDKLIVYGILMACIPFISLSIMRIYCHHHYSECIISIKKYWNKGIFWEMLSFTGWNFLGSASSLVGNYGIGLVMNYFYGTVLNAAQGIATQVQGQLMAFSKNMLKALSPQIAKSEGEGKRERMLYVSAIGNKFSFFLFSLLAFPVIFNTNFLFCIWLVKVPQWAVIFTQLQLIRILIEQTTAVYHTSIQAEGHIASYNRMVIFLDLLPIVLIYYLFSLGFSPVTFYVVTICVFGIGKANLKVYFMKRNCGMSYCYFWENVLKPMLIITFFVCVICFPFLYLMEESFSRFLLVSFFSLTSCIIGIWLWGLGGKEKVYVIDVISNFIRRHS
ncbi:MAG: hypothetical protein J5661_03210 [Bacteroidaceae bacterium]|nr:hypothetical protein [Bacteroidaceae bacterium]